MGRTTSQKFATTDLKNNILSLLCPSIMEELEMNQVLANVEWKKRVTCVHNERVSKGKMFCLVQMEVVLFIGHVSETM